MASPVAAQTAAPAKGKGGKLRSIRIRKIESGFLGSCEYEPKEGKEYSYMPDKEYALADRAAIHAFVDDVFDFGEKKKSAKKEDKDPADWGKTLNRMRAL